MTSRRVIGEYIVCAVLDAEKEFKHTDDPERRILVVDRVLKEIEAFGLRIVESEVRMAEREPKSESKEQ